MNKPVPQIAAADLSLAQARWEQEFAAGAGQAEPLRNRSGVEIKPLYTPRDWSGAAYADSLGFPGEFPYTRGIYPTMYRGRSWSQRQLIGLGVPEDYNSRIKEMLALGASALSLIPCNSVFRGYDADEVPAELLGTCGTVMTTRPLAPCSGTNCEPEPSQIGNTSTPRSPRNTAALICGTDVSIQTGGSVAAVITGSSIASS